MTRPSDAPDRLVRAGVELLATGGWVSITSRSVAELAGVNLGLVQYHFGGMPRLRRAIAAEAVEMLVGTAQRELLAAEDVPAVVAAIDRAVRNAAGDRRAAQLSAAVIEGAVRDPEQRETLRDALRRVRVELSDHLLNITSGLDRGTASSLAALLVAASDGLILHASIDPDLAESGVLPRFRTLLGGVS